MSPFVTRLFYFALIYTCVEGLVINMTFPSKVGFVVKDAALFLAYLSVFGGGEGHVWGSLRRLKAPVASFAFVQTAYLLLPLGLPLLARSVGWKQRLLYIPLMFLAYKYIRSYEDYRRLALTLIAVAIPVSIFGIYLFFAGPEFLRAIGGTYSAVVYSTTGFWRVPGTFTSPGQYGIYLTFNLLLAMTLLLGKSTAPRERLLVYAGLAVTLLAMLASGSRTPLILAAACVGLTLVSLGKVGRMLQVAILLYAIFAVGFATLGAGVADRVDSIASTEHIARFQRTYFGQLFLSHLEGEPMGIGLGSATIGARHFTEYGQIVFIESYFGLVAIETGIIGLMTILWVAAAVVVYFWRSRQTMTRGDAGTSWHLLALFACSLIALLPVGTPIDAAPGNIYFWLALGICARLYDLERHARAQLLPDDQMTSLMYPPYPPVPPPKPAGFR